MDKKTKLKGMLGLAYKAHALTVGTELSVEKARNGRCLLMLMATDAAQNSRKKIENCCEYNHIPLCETELTKEELARCIGHKSEVSVVSLTNQNFVNTISALCLPGNCEEN